MLGKLLKYDLKFVNKVLVVFIILAMFFAGVTRGLFELDNSLMIHIFSQISQGITISMIISLFINCFMRNWVRFIKNIYGDESYLTHTLPVNKNQIYLSKVLALVLSMLASIVVTLICVFIMYGNKENFEVVKNVIKSFSMTYEGEGKKLIIFGLIALFLQFISLAISAYTGIIIGHKANNNRILKSVIYSFVTYIFSQIIILSALYLASFVNPSINDLYMSKIVTGAEGFLGALYVSIASYAIVIIINCIVDLKLLNKGVNVD